MNHPTRCVIVAQTCDAVNMKEVMVALGEFAISVGDKCFAGIQSTDDLWVTCEV
jgi:hypothetical protein